MASLLVNVNYSLLVKSYVYRHYTHKHGSIYYIIMNYIPWQ